MLVKEFMIRDITSVSKTTTIEYLIKTMFRHRRTTIPVVNEINEIIGSISMDEVIHASLPNYFKTMFNTAFIPDTNQFSKTVKKIKHHKVSDYMNNNPITATETDTSTRIADLFTKNDIKSIFVTNGKQLIGFINRIDLMQSILDDHEMN